MENPLGLILPLALAIHPLALLRSTMPLSDAKIFKLLVEDKLTFKRDGGLRVIECRRLRKGMANDFWNA